MRRYLVRSPFYSLRLLSTSFLLFSLSCEEKQSAVIDAAGFPPQIISATLSPSAVNSDTINVGPERKPDDLLSYEVVASARIIHPLGQNYIEEAYLTFFRTKRDPGILRSSLYDNGAPPDSIPGDSLFTGYLRFSKVRSEIGFFHAEIVSADAEGNRSNSVRVPFTLLRQNHPPVLSNLVAPDTVHPSTQSFFVVTVVATDTDGLTDILSVTRTTPSNLVLFLNDEGLNGDGTAGDGIYTETISLFPAPQPGSYEFKFMAVDRSQSSSQIITKTIVVAP